MRRRQEGYILLYVLGVLLVLGMLALSVAYKQRIGFRLVMNAKESLQYSLALRSAAALTTAQLVKVAELDGLVRAKDPATKEVNLWKPGAVQEVQIGDERVSITLTEQVSAPNINLFDEKELQRLFVALGAKDSDASAYAQAFLKAKPKDGFTSQDALIAIAGIPERYLTGQEPEEGAEQADAAKAGDATPKSADKAAAGDKGSKRLAGLASLVSVTGGSKKIDLNKTPLEVVTALTGLAAEKIGKLGTLREKGYLDRETAIAELGPEIAAFIGTSNVFRGVFTLANRTQWATAMFTAPGRWRAEAYQLHEDGEPPPDEAAGKPAVKELNL